MVQKPVEEQDPLQKELARLQKSSTHRENESENRKAQRGGMGKKGSSQKKPRPSRHKSANTISKVVPNVQPKKNSASIKSQEDKTKQPRRRPMPAVFRVLFSVIMLWMMAMVFAWFAQYRQLENNTDKTWEFIEDKPLVYWYSCFLLFLMMATLSSVLWRPFLSTGITFSVLSILMYINAEKYRYRAAPLLPEDFQMINNAGNLMQFIDIWSVVRLILGVFFILLGSGVLEHIAQRHLVCDKSKMPYWERHALVPRATFALMSFTALSLFSTPIIHRGGKTSEDEVDFLDTVFTAWNQTMNYEDNGFILGFLYNCGSNILQKPDEYSKDRIQEIALKYQKVKSQDDARKDLSDVADNVIVILDETFYDPSLVEGHYAHTGGDVTPNLHEIFQKYPSGYMYSPEYGGGTANVEFAVFTGFSNYWANTTPYVNAISKAEFIPGIVGYTGEQDFETTAIHAYDGTMYKRNVIYNKMGFETFLDSKTMTHTERENGRGHISDKETFQEIIDILGDGEEKHFVGAITMQNHGPYESAQYDEWQFKLLEEKSNWSGVEAVMESIHHADQYLADFLSQLDQLDSRTVVLWFGDHAAGVLDDYVNSDDKHERDLAHLTPYFIYSNFELSPLYSEEEVAIMNEERGFTFSTAGVDLPVVSPNCLTNEMYDILNIKKPALMYLLDTVCVRTPILAGTYFDENLKPDTYTELEEYELINYDILGGKRYWLDFVGFN